MTVDLETSAARGSFQLGRALEGRELELGAQKKGAKRQIHEVISYTPETTWWTPSSLSPAAPLLWERQGFAPTHHHHHCGGPPCFLYTNRCLSPVTGPRSQGVRPQRRPNRCSSKARPWGAAGVTGHAIVDPGCGESIAVAKRLAASDRGSPCS